MTNTKTEVQAVETPKVNKRGIGTARGTQRLKFSNEDAKPNELFIGHLDSVEVKTITIGEDTTGMPSFNGMEIPKLVLTFTSNEQEANKRKYTYLQFNAVESTAETIPGGKGEWKVNLIFDWMKHILVAYGRELTPEEEDALSLPFVDFNEQGEYEPINVEEVIAGWKSVFDNFAAIVNGTNIENGVAIYKDKAGKFIPIWMKLIRFIKNRKKGWQPINNGELSFPSMVGEGCIEKFKPNVMPSIRVNPINETIKIIKEEAPVAKTPSAMPPMGGIPVMDNMVPDMNDLASMQAGMDSPF